MKQQRLGFIAWFVNNRVTPNLLMLVLLIGGLFTTYQIKKEFLPDVTLDRVEIAIAYPGATPEEVESGIVLAVEEAVQGLDGIDEMISTANEGGANIGIDLRNDADSSVMYQDIQQAINSITTLPENAEKPMVKLASRRRSVVWLKVFGDVSEWNLKEAVEIVRNRLLNHQNISEVTIRGAREYRIWIEVNLATLRSHGMSIGDIAQIINNSSLEYSGGRIETKGGEILLRMNEKRDWAREYGDIPIITSKSGTPLTLNDIATIREGFADTDTLLTWNGKRSLSVSVYRVADQTPIGVSDAVKEVMKELEGELPAALDLQIAHDRSDVYKARLNLLLKNAFIGLCLVLTLLALFLEYKLAFWVTVGIPTAFLGSIIFLPFIGVSINMISMFAFIMALGIVVDDAIIAGENIYEYRQQGMSMAQAAIEGVKDVAVPVTFSILSNVMAFMPLMFVPGTMGKLFVVIPLTVITIFLLSWVEAILILPAHLAHSNPKRKIWVFHHLEKVQKKIDKWLYYFINKIYKPFLVRCLNAKVITLALAIAILILAFAYMKSGRMGFNMMPRVEGDRAQVTARLPYGSPMSYAVKARDRLTASMLATAEEVGKDKQLKGYSTYINENTIEVTAYQTKEESRPISTGEFAKIWREKTGKIEGVESLRYETDIDGPSRGAGLTVELTHRYPERLDAASKRMEQLLEEYPNVTDVKNSFSPGKQQFVFSVKDEGKRLGLSAREIARQVRSAFYGAEALRQQRGRHELRVMVRLPESERISIKDIDSFMIKTPQNTWVALMQVANLATSRAYTSINHRDGLRTVSLTTNVSPPKALNKIVDAVSSDLLPRLKSEFPGLNYSFRGKQERSNESMGSLKNGFIVLLGALYILLAIPFKNYIQPLIVMVAIPFGAVGAIAGHIIMDYGLSIMSIMGILALSGVVVNDSLVLVEYSNRQIAGGMSKMEAIVKGATRRFRPILLTTITTFGGLIPMIMETSVQAKFLIPMAVSVGFGILFATLITLILVPTLFMLLTPEKKQV